MFIFVLVGLGENNNMLMLIMRGTPGDDLLRGTDFDDIYLQV